MSYALVAALIWQAISFLRELASWSTQRSAVVTQATAWAGGIGVVQLAAHAQMTQALVFPGTDRALGALDAWSLVLLGLMASSLASSAFDVTKAIDTSSPSTPPPLLGPVGRHEAPAG